MNFLDQIWLIPLFPLFGAAMMLLFGRKLDPQPESDVAVVPGLEHKHDEHDHSPHHHGHTHEHSHEQVIGHDHSHAHGGGLKTLVSLLCPGMVLLAFIWSAGAVVQLAQPSRALTSGDPVHLARWPAVPHG